MKGELRESKGKSQVLDGLGETRYNRLMELVQLKSLFADLKQKASDLRGFL